MSLTSKGRLQDRSTLDVVVLIFAGIVAAVMIGAVVTLSVLSIVNPTLDTTAIVDYIYGAVTTILGSLIGLVAGQAKGRADAIAEQAEGGSTTRAE